MTEKERMRFADDIVKMEWECFTRVENEGGRASCQDDRETFEIMRKSQYLAWPEVLLAQYATEFAAAVRAGRNPVAEKYAFMMRSTAPQEFAAIRDQLPAVTDKAAGMIQMICMFQVAWMEDFARRYPFIAGRSRAIHTSDDLVYGTSYETYLRGELCTYSEELLSLYLAFVMKLSQKGANLCEQIMRLTAAFYGYATLDDAERAQRKRA